MSENLPVWDYARDVFKELTQPHEKLEAANFYFDALFFSTWYVAVRDRANLTPEEYLEDFQLTVRKMGIADLKLKVPDQDVFKLAVNVCDQFIGGKVEPEQLQCLKTESMKAVETISLFVDALNMGIGGYKIGENAIGAPKVITDSFYPLQLAEKLTQYTTPGGLVDLPPVSRKLLVAFITDEASCLKRISAPDATQG